MRVTESMGPAWERMKQALFRPFNLGTWFAFGFVFALQSCIDGGGGGNLPNPSGWGGGSDHDYGGGDPGGYGGYDTSDDLAGVAHRLGSSIAHAPDAPFDTGLVLVIGVVALLVAIPIMLLLFWLGSRGQMAAIRGVAMGTMAVGEAWTATASAGNALFKFHLALTAISAAAFLPLVAVGALMLYPAFQSGEAVENVLPAVLGLGVVALLLLVPLILVHSMTRNFVAPIMLLHGVGAREAWKRFWAHARNHVGSLVLFLFLRILVGFGAAIASIFAGLFTCCLGFLPILHQTVMAPYYFFERAWTLELLASLSPDFDFRAAPPAPPPYGGGPGYGGPFPGGGGTGGPGYGTDNPYAPPGYGPQGGYGPPGGYGGPA